MTYGELIQFFKSQAAAARVLGISQPSVCGWKDSGIPLQRQAQYEIITNGKLLAERPAPCLLEGIKTGQVSWKKLHPKEHQ